MARRAAVLVKLPVSLIEGEFTHVDNPGLPGDQCWKGANGVPFATRSLEGGTILFTLAPYEGEPDEAAYTARSALGRVLDNRDDKRGVLVFPDGAPVTAKSYEDVVADVADLGDWTPVVGGRDELDGRRRRCDEGAEVEAMLRQSKGELDDLKKSDPARWRELDEQFGGALTRMDADDAKKK